MLLQQYFYKFYQFIWVNVVRTTFWKEMMFQCCCNNFSLILWILLLQNSFRNNVQLLLSENFSKNLYLNVAIMKKIVKKYCLNNILIKFLKLMVFLIILKKNVFKCCQKMFFHVAVIKCCVYTEFSKNFQPCLIAKCLNILFVIYWSLKKERSDSIEKSGCCLFIVMWP